MNFGTRVIDYYKSLRPDWKLPRGFDLIYPFDNAETLSVFEKFFSKYFADNQNRHFLFGINPGRFGAGVTGIPFTDPKILSEICGIDNSFKMRNELSSLFIYESIEAFGGVEKFYSQFYITSVCPLGFLTKGKNCNYYDDRKLQTAVEKHILKGIQDQMEFGCNRNVAFSIGQGKNLKYLTALNDKHKFFDKIVPLPHPRWVMQYRLKRKNEFIDEYVTKLYEV